MNIIGKIPQNAVNKAEQLLEANIKPKNLKLRGLGYKTIRVGIKYRLLLKPRGKDWILCTHEKYNSLISR